MNSLALGSVYLGMMRHRTPAFLALSLAASGLACASDHQVADMPSMTLDAGLGGTRTVEVPCDVLVELVGAAGEVRSMWWFGEVRDEAITAGLTPVTAISCQAPGDCFGTTVEVDDGVASAACGAAEGTEPPGWTVEITYSTS